MNEELKSVSSHLVRFGLNALAHANCHANYHSMHNEAWSQLSVIQAAHAAELLIKGRIAQENPLLIFEKLPKPKDNIKLSLKDLFEDGITYQYSDLPKKLLASTGISLANVNKFREFGKLRNTIQHFTFPKDRDLAQDTLEFVFSVIDPFINDCWGLYAIDYNEDDIPYAYFVPNLIQRKIKFLISEDFLGDLEGGEMSEGIEWPKRDNSYTLEMKKRILDTQGRSK